MYLVCLHNVIAGEADGFDRKCSRISVDEFGGFLERVRRRYDLVAFSAFMDMLEQGRHDPRTAALTFDDGFLGVWRHAYPMLRGRGLDAAVFVNPPFMDGAVFHFLELEIAFRLTEQRRVLLDEDEEPLDLTTVERRVRSMKQAKRRLKSVPEARRKTLHQRLLRALGVTAAGIRRYAGLHEKFRLMDRSQVLGLRAAGWRIGSHTLTHRSLGMLGAKEAAREIRGSKRMLEEILGEAGTVFAYPYGEPVHIGETAPGICREAGYRYSFTTMPGDNRAGDDPHLLKRVDYREFSRDFLPQEAA